LQFALQQGQLGFVRSPSPIHRIDGSVPGN